MPPSTPIEVLETAQKNLKTKIDLADQNVKSLRAQLSIAIRDHEDLLAADRAHLEAVAALQKHQNLAQQAKDKASRVIENE